MSLYADLLAGYRALLDAQPYRPHPTILSPAAMAQAQREAAAAGVPVTEYVLNYAPPPAERSETL